jgi:hypothetical protein
MKCKYVNLSSYQIIRHESIYSSLKQRRIQQDEKQGTPGEERVRKPLSIKEFQERKVRLLFRLQAPGHSTIHIPKGRRKR